MSRILGFDPGLASTGWGVIDYKSSRLKHVDHGIILTSSKLPPELRLKEIYEEVSGLIDKYQPQACGVESLFFYKNISSAFPVAQAKGVLLLCCGIKGIPVAEFTPVQIKQSVVGTGSADKKQVQDMVQFLLGLKSMGKKGHDADALAAAVCLAHTGVINV